MDSQHEKHDIVIVGAGIAGLATALALHKIGLKSLVLEKAECLRTTGSAFNFFLNAWEALDALGVGQDIRKNYYQIEGVKLFSLNSSAKTQFSFVQNGIEIRCVVRKEVLEVLADAIPKDSIRFNSKVVSIHEIRDSSPALTNLKLSNGTSIIAQIVIGCDGVHSVVARLMGLGVEKPSRRYAFRGMATSDEQLENWIIQYNGNGVRAGYNPCIGNKVFWYVTTMSLPRESSSFKHPEDIRKAVLETIKGCPRMFEELIKSSNEDSLNFAEVGTRWVWPWKWEKEYGGKGVVALVGDAFHAMWPDASQGACLALEDAVVLARYLGLALVDKTMSLEESLKEYRDDRKWRVTLVAALAYVNGHVYSGHSIGFRLLRDWVVFPLSHFISVAMNLAKGGKLPTNSSSSASI